MTMAVELQSGPFMIAFTRFTVSFSPVQASAGGCSRLLPTTHETEGRFPDDASPVNCEKGTTFDHMAGSYRTGRIASSALWMKFPEEESP